MNKDHIQVLDLKCTVTQRTQHGLRSRTEVLLEETVNLGVDQQEPAAPSNTDEPGWVRDDQNLRTGGFSVFQF